MILQRRMNVDKTTKNGRIKIGECSVDSGQLLIIDPCYLGSWQDGNFDPDKMDEGAPVQNNYDEACRMTCQNDAGPVYRGLAVVSSTGWGDGVYPVYATFEGGRVTKLEVIFTDDDDDSEDGDA
jgi:hypothetical protein